MPRRSISSRCRTASCDRWSTPPSTGVGPSPARVPGPSSRTHLDFTPSRRHSSWTSATGFRASSRRCSATARRWGPIIHSRGSTRRCAALARHRTVPAIGAPHRLLAARAARRTPMNVATLEILRCPYLRADATSSTSLFLQRDGDEIHDGILGCQCCIFAVVDGIPVMHLDGRSTTARAHVEAGRPDLARRAMFNLDDEAQAARFDEVASSDAATYRDVVDALGPNFEGGYFLYRFSDPTYIVADAVVRSVAGHRAQERRARDRPLRRLRPPDAIAPRSVLAGAGPCGSVFLEDLARPPLYGAGLRGRVLRRQCPVPVCPQEPSDTPCAPTRSCTSGRSGSLSVR